MAGNGHWQAVLCFIEELISTESIAENFDEPRKMYFHDDFVDLQKFVKTNEQLNELMDY